MTLLIKLSWYKLYSSIGRIHALFEEFVWMSKRGKETVVPFSMKHTLAVTNILTVYGLRFFLKILSVSVQTRSRDHFPSPEDMTLNQPEVPANNAKDLL